jgi:gamma-glutamylaminecyclotransferase
MEHYLFVYGTLKSGFANNRFLKGVEFQKAHAFNLEMYNGTLYPFVKKGEGLVYGEVYKIDDKRLNVIDHLEGHPDYYKRELMEIETEDNKKLKAWIYLFDKASHYPKNENGNWQSPV